MKVFVYGTLKRGYGNNRLLATSHLVTEAYTEAPFDMINSGFPVIVPNEHGLPVKGEVWDIGHDWNVLENLDRLEGEGVMYDRRDIVVIPSPRHEGDRMIVSVYVGNPNYWGRRIGSANPLTDPAYVRDGYLEWSR